MINGYLIPFSYFPKTNHTHVTKQKKKTFSEIIENEDLPTSKAAFKKHHIYVLMSQLLQYEAIYPPDTVPVAEWRGEAVFRRKDVYTVHNSVKWLQNGKQVKQGEQPYKELPKRIIRKRKLEEIEDNNLPRTMSGFFGPWQVEDFVPPMATEGKVPRNTFGNVELFTPDMIPVGCVHLTEYHKLGHVAKKIGIDCAPAMVGWEHGKYPRPKMEGFVVCTENVEVLIAAWRQDNFEQKKKEDAERTAKSVTNWEKLVKKMMAKKLGKKVKTKRTKREMKNEKSEKEVHTHQYTEHVDLEKGMCVK